LVTAVVYAFLRFKIFGIPLEDTYKMSFDFRAIKNLLWHFLWTLNVPEEFKYQFISFFKINPKFVLDFYTINRRVWNFLLINLLFIYGFPLGVLFFFTRKKKLIKNYFKTSIFGLIWFVVGLLPVLFFPLHQYPYFLTIASIGLYTFFLCPLAMLFTFYKKKKLLIYTYLLLICSAWFFSSFINLRFTQSIHWINNRQKASRLYLKKIKEQFPNPETGTTIVLPEGGTLRFSLMNNEAAFFLYKDANVNLTYKSFAIPDECLLIKEREGINIENLHLLNQQYQECLIKYKIFFLNNK